MQLVAELKTRENLSNLTEVKPLSCHKVILYLKKKQFYEHILESRCFGSILLGVEFVILMQAHQAVYDTVITYWKKYMSGSRLIKKTTTGPTFIMCVL